jgi:hypothetical protein
MKFWELNMVLQYKKKKLSRKRDKGLIVKGVG